MASSPVASALVASPRSSDALVEHEQPAPPVEDPQIDVSDSMASLTDLPNAMRAHDLGVSFSKTSLSRYIILTSFLFLCEIKFIDGSRHKFCCPSNARDDDDELLT